MDDQNTKPMGDEGMEETPMGGGSDAMGGDDDENDEGMGGDDDGDDE